MEFYINYFEYKVLQDCNWVSLSGQWMWASFLPRFSMNREKVNPKGFWIMAYIILKMWS